MTEIEVAVFATGLLLVRLVSIYLVTDVAVKQLRIWRRIRQAGAVERARYFRALLFGLAVAMLLKNIVPLGIDLIAISAIGDITLSFSKLSDSIILQYFTSNAIFDLIMSVIIWLLYREARKYT